MRSTTRNTVERFGVAVITVVGLLSLALALHIDAVDARAVDARTAHRQ